MRLTVLVADLVSGALTLRSVELPKKNVQDGAVPILVKNLLKVSVTWPTDVHGGTSTIVVAPIVEFLP